jgi:hypothetical protein
MTMETKPAMTAMGTEMINVQYCYALYYTTAPQPAYSVFKLKLELRCITRRLKAFLWDLSGHISYFLFLFQGEGVWDVHLGGEVKRSKRHSLRSTYRLITVE